MKPALPGGNQHQDGTLSPVSYTHLDVYKRQPMTPVAMPTITVKTSNASISVIIVPPTVIVTDLSFVIPNLLIIG